MNGSVNFAMNGSVNYGWTTNCEGVQPSGVPAELADQLSDRFAAPHTALEDESPPSTGRTGLGIGLRPHRTGILPTTVALEGDRDHREPAGALSLTRWPVFASVCGMTITDRQSRQVQHVNRWTQVPCSRTPEATMDSEPHSSQKSCSFM